MKIAVPVTHDNQIDGHFGHCESYSAVVRGCSGDAADVVKLYLSGLVEDSGSSCQQHEAHKHDGHQCNHS